MGLGGAWVDQVVKHPTSAQVTISQLVSSSPTSGSVLTVWSLPRILSSLFAPPMLVLSLKISK